MNIISQQTAQRIGVCLVLLTVVIFWASNAYMAKDYISKQNRRELKHGEKLLRQSQPDRSITILMERLYHPGKEGKNTGYSATYSYGTEQKTHNYYVEWD